MGWKMESNKGKMYWYCLVVNSERPTRNYSILSNECCTVQAAWTKSASTLLISILLMRCQQSNWCFIRFWEAEPNRWTGTKGVWKPPSHCCSCRKRQHWSKLVVVGGEGREGQWGVEFMLNKMENKEVKNLWPQSCISFYLFVSLP